MIRLIIKVILIIMGALCISYPFIAKAIGYLNQSEAISNYQENVKIYSEEKKKEELEKAENYNEELQKDSYIDISLDNEKTEDNSYLNVLNVGEIMAYINIPKIDANLPIYHGISNDILNAGIGHLESSSLPIGGKGTHCVLTGHTGLANRKMFDDIRELQIGDEFYIYVLDRVLKYQVDNISTVLPEETEAIRITPNEDYVTLVTCTPPVLNTHRLLVRGTRDEDYHYNDNSDNAEKLAINTNKIKEKSYINIAIVSFIVIILFIYMILNFVKYIKRNK